MAKTKEKTQTMEEIKLQLLRKTIDRHRMMEDPEHLDSELQALESEIKDLSIQHQALVKELLIPNVSSSTNGKRNS